MVCSQCADSAASNQSQDNVGVGVGVKGLARGLELRAQRAVVVDLAVEDDVVPAIRRRHRLVAARRRINDRQASMNQ